MTVPFQVERVSVGPALTLLLEIPLAGLQPNVSFQIVSDAGSAETNNFVILRKLHDAGDWLTYLGGSDFTVASSKCTQHARPAEPARRHQRLGRRRLRRRRRRAAVGQRRHRVRDPQCLRRSEDAVKRHTLMIAD